MSQRDQNDGTDFEDEVLSSIEDELPDLTRVVMIGIDRDGDVTVLGFDREDDEGLLDEIGVFRLLGQGIAGLADIVDQEQQGDDLDEDA